MTTDDDGNGMTEYPAEIAALLEDARPLDAVSASMKASVRAKIHGTVGASPAPPATAAGKAGVSAGLSKAWFSLVAIAAIAAALWLSRSPADPRASEPASEPALRAASMDASTVAIQHEQPRPSEPIAAVADASTVAEREARDAAASQGASVRGSPEDSLAEEQRLLDRARGMLASSDADGALSVLGQHARRYARGVLAMERDALRVRALMAADRSDEARAAADRFVARWPSSALRAAVETMVR